MEPLRILVIDAHPAIALPVIDAVRELGHRAETQSSGQGAVQAVIAKHRASRPYHLLLASITLVDLDPVGLLQALRQYRQTVPVCFYANTHALSRATFTAVEQLGGRFVSLPLDRTRLETLINDAIRGVSRPSEGAGESPFFGTGRITRRSSSSTESISAPNRPVPPLESPLPASIPAAPPLPPANALPPVAASITRASTEPPPDPPSDVVLRGTAQFDTQNHQARYLRTPPPGIASTRPIATPLPPPPNRPTSERYRRSVDPHQRPPDIGSSSRIRRSITGKVVNPHLTAPPQAINPIGNTRVATCAACGRQFYAELRATPYSLPCLHCGHLNRIDPT